MWNEGEKMYFEEVLGIAPPTLVQAAASAPRVVDIVVLTPELNETGAELLTKILSSVQLFGLPIYQSLPADLHVLHVLTFDGTEGVRGDATTTYWGFAEIRAMCGTGTEVNTLKRRAWAQLKQFREVFKSGAK